MASIRSALKRIAGIGANTKYGEGSSANGSSSTNASETDAASGSLAWRGEFANWSDAVKHSRGYEQSAILEEVKVATLKVKNGEAAYERDGVLFDKIEYAWPLLSILLKAALENGGKLTVADFGGSLGSSFFQNRDMLALGSKLHWYIAEQSHFVDCGREYFEDESLKFVYSLEEISEKIDLLLLSGVLAYLDAPYQYAESFNKTGAGYIIIDRNAFIRSDNDLLTTQLVADNMSYPTWFMNKQRLLDTFSNYTLVAEFEDKTTQPVVINGKECYWAGLILTKLR